ncbi:MAG: hypothetical protein EA355_14685 [Rhodobacteraceae bacterium]|nr:MAG: hypothetical protein EA355_14685 [Paracoccaceae bacterium]
MPVEMNVMSHQLVGAWLARLTTAEKRPETLAGFMEGLAAYVNNALGVETIAATYVAARNAWRIPGVLEIFGVAEDAAAVYVSHAPEQVVIRLPDPELLAESRNLAVAFDHGGRSGEFYVDRFYYDYIRGGDYAPSNSAFLDSRIADYTFAQCR